MNAIRDRVRGEAANQPIYRAVTKAKNLGGFNRAEVEAAIGKAGADEIEDMDVLVDYGLLNH
ncbi:MAG: hypothetical protein LBJ46_04495 [Planctomycetota bacterium]|jgi:hypothetical protein|nr:hypothetical protein [Planctomycetota bacterium]